MRAWDASLTKGNTKVLFILALSYNTLNQLDAYVAMQVGSKLAQLETIQDYLFWVLYMQMLEYLRQGKLRKLHRQEPGGTIFVVHGGHKYLCSNAVDAIGAGEARGIGFASIMTANAEKVTISHKW